MIHDTRGVRTRTAMESYGSWFKIHCNSWKLTTAQKACAKSKVLNIEYMMHPMGNAEFACIFQESQKCPKLPLLHNLTTCLLSRTADVQRGLHDSTTGFEIADKFAVQPLCELLLSLRERVFDLLLELIPAYTHLQGSRGNIRWSRSHSRDLTNVQPW